MSARAGAPRVLHVHGSLAVGNPQAERCIRLIEAFGGQLHNTLVAAGGGFGSLESISPGIAAQRLPNFPKLSGLPLPGRLQRISRAMIDYDLVLTYGWGAIDAALAHTMFSQVHSLPPLIHHEDGSDQTARGRRGWRSKWYRRVGLGRSAGLVVPTELMEGVALEEWQQPMGRVKLIPDGVDLARAVRTPKSDAIPRLLKRPGERWVTCRTHFDNREDVAALVNAIAELESEWHLVILGEGPGKAALACSVVGQSLENRIHFAPALTDPSMLTALADIVAICGGIEPLPLAAIEAAAAGKPVAGFDVGEVAAALCPENALYLSAPGDAAGLRAGLQRLAGDRNERRILGSRNRKRAEAERDVKAMTSSYRRLYASAMGRETI